MTRTAARITLCAGSVLLLSSLSLPSQAAPASVRGAWRGTYEATAGAINGQEGPVSFRIIKQRRQAGGALLLKGTGKFGRYRVQPLTGAYDPRSGVMTVLLQFRSANPRLKSHSLTLVASDNKTFTGQFAITNLRGQNLGGGNATLTKR